MQANLGIQSQAYEIPREGPKGRMLDRMLRHKRMKFDNPSAQLTGEEEQRALMIADMEPEEQLDAILEWSSELDAEIQAETKEKIALSTREKVALQGKVEEHRLASIKDHLTGAYNRRYFEEEELPKIMSKLDRARVADMSHLEKHEEKQISFIFVDIDHFKQINDTLGHDFGDEAIRSMVRIITEMLRDYDTVVRWGGEEFIVMLDDISPEDAYKKAESFREGIENMLKTALMEKCKDEQEKEAVAQLAGTISVGVASHSSKDKNVSGEELIRRADAAMYHSKRTGRNKVTAYDERLVSLKEEKKAQKDIKA